MYKYRNIKGDKPTLEDVKKNDVIEIRIMYLIRFTIIIKRIVIFKTITATTHGAKLLPLGKNGFIKIMYHIINLVNLEMILWESVSLTNFEKSFENKSVTTLLGYCILIDTFIYGV